MLLTLASAGIAAGTVRAQDEAGQFAQALDARAGTASAAGPFAGNLFQQEGFNTTTGAGVSLADFSATVTFVNPTEPNAPPWDIGISFRRGGDAVQQIVVDSTGFWYDSPFPGGTEESGAVADFDTSPGASNTLDLVVDGERALFGVNGEFVTGVDLPPGVPADVEAGTGYFVGSVVAGRAIPYRDFQVWPLAPGELVPPTVPAAPTVIAEETPTPEPTPEATVPPTPAAAEDASLFAEILEAQEGVAPLAGPFTANLRETTGLVPIAWAAVDVADFHASATVEVPESTSGVPWNTGFMFDATPAGTLRLVVDSQGQVFFSTGANAPTVVGQADNLRTTPGETNVTDLLVAGGRALFGVNGALAASVALPTDASAADVGVGSAFYSDQIESDRLTAFLDFVVLPLDADAFGASGATTGVTGVTADQIAAFEERLTEIEAAAPVSGPFAGRLVEATPGTPPFASAGVSLADFGATATFANPDSAPGELWDSGFQFRTDATARNRIVVDSLGDVYATLAGQSPVKVATAGAFDAMPGGSNTLQLFVAGDEAPFGVNGELVAVVTLDAVPLASDVQIGTGLFNEDFVAGRVTDYRDFRVWETS